MATAHNGSPAHTIWEEAGLEASSSLLSLSPHDRRPLGTRSHYMVLVSLVLCLVGMLSWATSPVVTLFTAPSRDLIAAPRLISREPHSTLAPIHTGRRQQGHARRSVPRPWPLHAQGAAPGVEGDGSTAQGEGTGARAPEVIICGAGIIGASIAYYLTLKGLKPTVVDRSGVAAAAGGKGGGFLAGDWGSGVTDELHRKSFALHESLAKELNIESYRKITTLQVPHPTSYLAFMAKTPLQLFWVWSANDTACEACRRWSRQDGDSMRPSMLH